jgi:uncharacterized protein (DUF1697 family)
MASHIALLRGINVGGRNKVPMAELRDVVTSLGHDQVKTYIQSGNVLFSTTEKDTAKLAAALEKAITAAFGLAVSVVVLSRDQMVQILDRNPYPDEPNPKLVHVVFLNAKLPADMIKRIETAAKAAADKGSRDTLTATDAALYVNTPDGFGRSELAVALFRIIGAPGKTGVAATARNLATCAKLRSMSGDA